MFFYVVCDIVLPKTKLCHEKGEHFRYLGCNLHVGETKWEYSMALL